MNENKIIVGDVLVATWGYSMVLTSWVKVVKVSAKTLLVAELICRPLDAEEREANKLSDPGFLQYYVVPTDELKTRNGEISAQFRLYSDKEGGEGYHGYPDGMSSRLYFKKWDGRPKLEDHAD